MSTAKTVTMTAGSSPLSGRSNKSPKPSKNIILKLPSSALSRFPALPASDSQTETKERPASASPDSSSSTSTTAPAATAPVTTAATSTATVPAANTSGDNASDAASTPAEPAAPGATTPSGQSDASKKKGVPGPKPGNKRGLGQGVETTPRPRGKPGPKKKARLDDGTTEGQSRATTGGSHKLGPKANQGAINAGLRALDRTGKPCRKWERKPFELKSFTGVVWGVPTWRTPKTKVVEELSTEATENGATPNGDAGSKANNSASAVESEKSNSGDGDATPMNTNAASSPAPAAAAAA